MKLVLLITLLFGASLAKAQALDLMQSSPSLQWHSISNDVVEVIYPDYLQGESVYIANLVEHYSQFVGQTYGIAKPQKFDLIIRSEMAEPNGYVTLAPRRSEWYASSMFFPYVGSTEWYQTLSIHEYRHVNQFDYFNRRGTKFLYWIMGDFGEQLAVAMSLPSWFMEGDAVWTETKFTDGGRGRSPRFSARLKALVLGKKLPTFDEFLSGTYRTDVPNQYVYGYALVSHGVQEYGEELWQRVLNNTAQFPIPLRLYVSFERLTGQDFDNFYKETMNDLKTKWAADAPSPDEKEVDFRQVASPVKIGDSVYYVKYDLDSHTAIMRDHGGQTDKVVEIPFNNEVMSIDFSGNHAVYTEYLPDSRYMQKGSSDLFLVDLDSGKKHKITDGERIYNPSFNTAGTKIIATDFRVDQSWNISEFDLQGKLLQTFTLPDAKVAAARYWDDRSAVAIIGSKTGLKSIVLVDLQTKKITKTLLAPSRNLITSLYVDKNKNLFFEGQYQGHNEIFRANEAGMARCTNAKLGAFNPSSDGTNLYYANMDTYGSAIATASLSSCTDFPTSELVDFKYLGKTPSDNYNDFSLQAFPDQEQLFTKNADKYHAEPYGDFDSRLWVPHTWGLMLGRGGGLGFSTDNYLRTLSINALAGTSPEESQGFVDLSFDVKKYYPIFTFQLEDRHRRVTDFVTSDKTKWEEKTAGVVMTVPYLKKRGLYNFATAASLGAAYVDASNYEFNYNSIDTTNFFYKGSGILTMAWYKDPTPRSIMAPWLLSYKIRYDDATQPSDSTASSYRTFQEAILQTPGAFASDGFKFVWDQQKQDDSPNAYRFLPEGESATGYVFSRGYSYEDVPGYQKLSANYVFPVAYPDWNLGGWYYLKRLYSTLFFDSTYIDDQTISPTLNSYGAELEFESTILRFIPLTFGVRVLERLEDNQTRGEFFLATAVGF